MGAAKELRRRVAVPNEAGELQWYGPGDKVPAAVAKQITNPAAWADGESDADADPAEASSSAQDDGQPITGDYDDHKVAALQIEVVRRNDGRDEADQIEVGGKGNKADLVKALEADDAAQANA